MESKMKPRVPSSAVSVAKKMFESSPPPFPPTLLRCGHVFQSFSHVLAKQTPLKRRRLGLVFSDFATVVFLFLFDKYCPIIN
jgi:hypothetical protein